MENKAKKGGNRTCRVTVRFTEQEFQHLKTKANATVSRELADYIRHTVAGQTVTVLYRNRSLDDWMQELILLRKELNALGNNFNQVTKKVNATAGKTQFEFWVQQAFSLQAELVLKVEVIKSKIEKFAHQWFAGSSPGKPSGDC